MLIQEADQENDILKRNHFIEFDNAPTGRKHFWASHLNWITLIGAHIRKSFTKEPIKLAIEETAMMVNPILLIIGGTFLSIFAIHLLGGPIGVMATLCLLINPWINPFNASHFDHHGVIQLFLASTLLGIMGATKGPHPKLWMSLAGISTGLLLWTSAFTAIPIIAALSIGGTVMTLTNPQKHLPWHIWGTAAAITSFLTYLVEYAPNQFTFLLDTNNPLYCACAWVAGLIPQTAALWRKPQKPWKPTLLILIIGSLPLALLAYLGSDILYTKNPWGMAHMAHEQLQNQEMGKLSPINLPAVILLIAAAGFLACQNAFRKEPLPLFGLVLCSMALILQLLMTRNTPISCALFLTALLLQPLQNWSGSYLLLITLLSCASPWKVMGFSSTENLRKLAIENTIPAGSNITSTPDNSLPIAYYLNGKSAGSPYWENWPNLFKAHAKIALEEPKAMELLDTDQAKVLVSLTQPDKNTLSKSLILGPEAQKVTSLWDKLAKGETPNGWKKVTQPSDPLQIYLKEQP